MEGGVEAGLDKRCNSLVHRAVGPTQNESEQIEISTLLMIRHSPAKFFPVHFFVTP